MNESIESPFAKQLHSRSHYVFIAAGFLASIFISLIFIVANNEVEAKQITTRANLEPLSAPSTITLFSPEQTVRAGTKLSDVKFRETFWINNNLPQGAMQSLEEIRGMYAKIDLQPSIPVVASALTKQPRLGMNLPLSMGMRAISIEIDETQGIEGFAIPGTKVDVTLTRQRDSELKTNVIVQNARVLSVGGEASTYMDGTRRVSGRTMTLEVSPYDALKIQTSKQLGRLGLLLRSLDDDHGASITSMSQAEISNGKNDPKSQACGGKARIGDKEYIISCDGSPISEVVS